MSQEKEDILPPGELGTQAATLPWVSNLMANSADCGVANLPNYVSQFL
jgi:hypothetical protein